MKNSSPPKELTPLQRELLKLKGRREFRTALNMFAAMESSWEAKPANWLKNSEKKSSTFSSSDIPPEPFIFPEDDDLIS